MRDVNGGHMIRYFHMNGASLFFVAVYIHMFRGLYYGSYKAPREITWIIGMLIYLCMMGTAFMGYVLPWGQMSFHGTAVITGLFGAIPFVGDSLQTWLLGAGAVGQPALNRFFSLHYLLPFVIAALVVVHIWAFHTTGNNNPTGVEVRRGSKEEAEKGHPAVLALLRDQGPVRAGRDPDRLRGHRRLHAELPGPPGQLHRGQRPGDADAYRARMVLSCRSTRSCAALPPTSGS